ncbi:hypothetical protein [Streptomyces sp. ODS28]|uniref:DUF7144 family membrane protein n=1 Tax=Streptomyces sp. ODS28 TaxID=3136688 RepID=UPI0031EEF181
MSDTAKNSTGTNSTGAARKGGDADAWASGGVVFAGALMLLDGVLGVLAGIAGIAEDDVFTRLGSYVFKFDLTTWGWIHLIVGILVALAGVGVLNGSAWARMVGVGLASVMVILQFLWLPYQPLWSLISIALAVFVIWALTARRLP